MKIDDSSNEENEELKVLLSRYKEMIAGNKENYFDADDFLDIADHYIDEHQLDKASEVIVHALVFHPDNTEIRVVEAQLYIDQDQIKKATELAYAITDTNDSDVRLLKARLLLLDQKREKAEEIILGIVNEKEKNISTDLLLDIAYLYLESSYPDLAIKWFEKVRDSKQYAHDLTLKADMAECYSLIQKEEEAENLYNEILDEDPYSITNWKALGMMRYNFDHYNKAIEAYEYACTIDSKDPSSIFMLISCYYQLDNYEKSLKYCDTYLEISKEREEVYFMMGVNNFKLQRYEKCFEAMGAAIKYAEGLSVHSIEMHLYMARATSFLGKKDKAIQIINTAIEMDHKYPSSYVAKGSIYLEYKEYDNAEKCFKEALTITTESAEIYISIGKAYMACEKYDQAIEYFSVVEDRWKYYVEVYSELAEIYRILEDEEKYNYYSKIRDIITPAILKEVALQLGNIEDVELILGKANAVNKRFNERSIGPEDLPPPNFN